MRGRNDMNRSQGQRRRRCILAGLLCASGQGAWADSPVAIAPLPLAIPFEQGGQYVQINPFCRPVTTSLDDATVHAAGTIQLTPLEPLPESQVMQSSGQRFETPLTTPADGGVQFRIEASSAAGDDADVGPHAYPVPLAYPVPVPIVAVEPFEEHLTDADEASSADEAISFSLSDDSGNELETTLVRPTRGVHATVVSAPEPVQADPVEPAPAESQPQTRPRAVWRGGSDQVVQRDPPSLSGPTDASSLPSPAIARPVAGSNPILVPIEEHQDAQVVTAVGSARLPAPTRLGDEPRLINGARPKVEVGRPPLVVQRGQSRILTVEPERPAPTPLAHENIPAEREPQMLPEPVAKANLRFQPTEVRALKVDNPIQRVEIQSVAVCAAVKTGSHQVQLIATGVGKTKLTLWTIDAGGQEQGELYEIQVADARTAQADDAQSIAATLTQSIQTAFPASEIAVRYHGGRLLVSGNCPDEGSARRILRMVRSACPMPVDDQIKVR